MSDHTEAALDYLLKHGPIECVICGRKLDADEPIQVNALRWRHATTTRAVAAVHATGCAHHTETEFHEALARVFRIEIHV